MRDFEYSEHAQDVLKERKIQKSWVKQATNNPDKTELPEDGTVHYIKSIAEFGNRHLRVVVNPAVSPQRIVTLFFDRRIRNTS